MKAMKLGNCATFINGYAFKPSDWEESGIPIIRIQNLTGSQNSYNYSTKQVPEKYIVNNGDILVSWSASIGVYEWTNGTAILNQHIFKVELDKEDFDKDYFRYLLISKINTMLKRVHGSTMVHITKKDFDNIDVLIHSKEEQIRIGKELKIIDRAIENKKEALQDFNEMIKSVYYDSLKEGYDEKKLSEIGSSLIGLTYSPKDIHDDGVVVLRSSNIQNGKLDFNDIVRVNAQIKENKFVKEKDILICSRNGSKALVGKSALISNLKEKMTFGAFMSVYRSDYNEFLISFFQTNDFRKQLGGSSTATINQITSSMLNNIIVKLPKNIDLINKASKKLSNIYKLQELLKNDIADLEQLKSVKMNEYFK